MGWGIEEAFDLIRVGGGYDHESGEGSAVGKASVSAVIVAEEKVWNGYDDVPNRSFFTLVGAEGICATNGNCRLGAEVGLGFVPGVLGAFAGPKIGVSHDFGDGHNKAHLAFELDVLDPISPLTEMWSLEGRVTRDFSDGSIGFGLFLTVGGSAMKAVEHN
jgi:hypothetical protein